MSSRLHRLIEWPLWSWRNLSVTAAGLFLVLALVGKAMSSFEPQPISGTAVAIPSETSLAPQTPYVETSPTTTSTKAPSAGTPSPEATGVGQPRNEPCEAAASAFMSSWVKTTLSSSKWLDGLRPHAVPKLVDQLSHTDPSSVPASRVSAKPVQAFSRSGSDGFRFATDGGRVDVMTRKAGGSCLVSDLEPASEVPGAPTPTLTPAQVGS